MGKKSGSKKKTKFMPLNVDGSISGCKSHHKRSEVETTNVTNSKVDVKNNQVGNNNECDISIIEEGIKLDGDTSHEKNVPDSSKIEKKVLCMEHQKNSSNDTTAQNEKMECDKSIFIIKNDKKSNQSSDFNRKKHIKTEYCESKINLDGHNQEQNRQHNQNEEKRETKGFEKHSNSKKDYKEEKQSPSLNREKNNTVRQTTKEQHNQNKDEKEHRELIKERINEKNHDKSNQRSSLNKKEQNKEDIAQPTSKEHYNKTLNEQHNQNKDELRKPRSKDREGHTKNSEAQKPMRKNQNRAVGKYYNKDNDSSHKRNRSHSLNKKKDICQSLIEDGECVLEEIDENLFNLSDEFAFAHCVAEDLRMGAGIAVDFKRIFGGVGKLIDQHLKVGDVGEIYRKNRYIFYLITKKKSSGKPTMNSLNQTLHTLLGKMKEYKLTKLGIPKIGCGLDGLDWSNVKSLINSVFTGSGIHITACLPSMIKEEKRPPSLKVYITPKNLWEMDIQTHIIIFIDLEKLKLNNWSDKIVDKVNDRYPFKQNLLKDIKTKTPNSGEIINYRVKDELITCAFVEQNSYHTCIEKVSINIKLSLKGYSYLAIQSGSLDSEDNFKSIAWIVLILRSIINRNELWLCGNTELEEVAYDEYCRNKHNISINSSMRSFLNNSVNFDSSNPMDYTNSSNSQERINQNWNRSSSKQNNYGKNCSEQNKKFINLSKSSK